MRKIKKGDEVVVIAGRDKGRRGIVLSVLLAGKKLLVEGINTVKKHKKGNPEANDKGGIIIINQPIDASNVMFYDHITGKGCRIGIKILEDGRKVRFNKATNEVIDV